MSTEKPTGDNPKPKGARRGASDISSRNPLLHPPQAASGPEKVADASPWAEGPSATKAAKASGGEAKKGLGDKAKAASSVGKAIRKKDPTLLGDDLIKKAAQKGVGGQIAGKLTDMLPDKVDADGNVTAGKAKETVRDLGSDAVSVATAAAKGYVAGNLAGAAMQGAKAALTSKTGKKVGKKLAAAAVVVAIGGGMAVQQMTSIGTSMVASSTLGNDSYSRAAALTTIEDRDSFTTIQRAAAQSGVSWEILVATWQVSSDSGLNNGTGPFGIDLDTVEDDEIDQVGAMDLETSALFVGARFSEAMRGTVSSLQNSDIEAGAVESVSEDGLRQRSIGEDDSSKAAAEAAREQYIAAIEMLPLVNIENQAGAIFSTALGWRLGNQSQCELPSAGGEGGAGLDGILVGETGASLNEDQVKYAQAIINRVAERGLSSRAALVALATVQQESKFRMYWSIRVPGSKELAPDPSARGSDHYSVGLYQQQVNGNKFAWGTVDEAMDVVKSTDMFLDALLKVNGWEDMHLSKAAQSVQISAFPDAYAQWEDLARTLVKDLPPTNGESFESDHSHEAVVPAGETNSSDDASTDDKDEGTETPAAGDVAMSAGKNPYNLKVDSTLKSDTQAIQADVVNNWGEYVYSMGGYRAGSVGHSQRIATDLMVVDYKSAKGIAAGNAMTEYFIQNKDQLGVNYIIWRNQIWLGAKTGWKPYKDGGFGKHLAARGWDDTTLHYDHLHVEVFGSKGTGGGTSWDPSVKTIEGDDAVFSDGSDASGGGATGGSGDSCAGGGMAGTSPVGNMGGELTWGDDYPYRDPQGDCSWCAGSKDPGADPWQLYKRECVSFVAWRVNQLMGWKEGEPYPFTMAKMGMAGQGNAKHWGHSLKKKGYKVDMTPAIGAVAWWDGWESNQYYQVYGMGHVAIVKSIDGDMVTMEQYNGSTVLGANERSRYTTMVLHKDAVTGYIHIADVQADTETPADTEEDAQKEEDAGDNKIAAGLQLRSRETV